MLAQLLFFWGALIVLVWAMLKLDNVWLTANPAYAIGVALLSMAIFYGLLSLMAGWQPDWIGSTILSSWAFSILADRRRHRIPYPRQ